MKYKIKIEELKPYNKTITKYDATDGKRYGSMYSIPKDLEYKEVTVETGEIGYTETEIFSQEVESLDLVGVIKAVNKID